MALTGPQCLPQNFPGYNSRGSGCLSSQASTPTDSSLTVHNTLASWFRVSSSSISSFSVHPSLPPLPKGARAPSPQPSCSLSLPYDLTNPPLVSPAPASTPRQRLLVSSWSFEWRGISKAVKSALNAQSQRTPTSQSQTVHLHSPQSSSPTLPLGIPQEALEARDRVNTGQHVTINSTHFPRAPTPRTTRLFTEEPQSTQPERVQGRQSYISDSGQTMTSCISMSEVHLPRYSSNMTSPQQPHIRIVPTRPQQKRSKSMFGNKSYHSVDYNASMLDINGRKAFSDCGHSDNTGSRVPFATNCAAYSDVGHVTLRDVSPSYAPVWRCQLPNVGVGDETTVSLLSSGPNTTMGPCDNAEGQRLRTTSSRSSSENATCQPRKLRRRARSTPYAARSISSASDSPPRSKLLPPTPPLPSEVVAIAATGRKPKSRKLTKRISTRPKVDDSPLYHATGKDVDGEQLQSHENRDSGIVRRSNEHTRIPRTRPSFLRTESNRRWTVAVADVPDELLIEEIEYLRRLGMRADELHGNPDRRKMHSLYNLRSSMNGEYEGNHDMEESAEVSSLKHTDTDTTELTEEEEWIYAQRAILCCKELIRTERTYQHRLWELAHNQVSDKVPALAQQYLPALIDASVVLCERFAGEPSVWGVSNSFLEVQSKLESAFVSWCGVVGEFFSRHQRKLGGPLSDAKGSTHRARTHGHNRKPAVLRRLPRKPSTTVEHERIRARSVSVQDLTTRAWSNMNRSPTSQERGFPIPPPPLHDRVDRKDRKPTFRDLAILPTQRVTRYVLLFKDLLKHTPASSPTHHTIQQALDCANNLATKCDRAQGNANFLYVS